MDQFKAETKREANELNLLNLMETRMMEVIHIEKECKKKLPKLFHQRLPRFMRRRAACHNLKRTPKKVRPRERSDFGLKNRKTLLKYRRRLRFRKHKRVLQRRSKRKHRDPTKILLHNWFAKRFKIQNNIPILNNTKNQRNLRRETIYGCAYISMAHLIAIRLTIDSKKMNQQLKDLDSITKETSGFIFSDKILRKANYEVVIHLYSLKSKQYICPSLVSLSKSMKNIIIWLPIEHHEQICNDLNSIQTTNPIEEIETVNPCECIRVRLYGPESQKEAQKIAQDPQKHIKTIENATKLPFSFGLEVGSHLEEMSADFTYYNMERPIVDIIFKDSNGRLLWNKLTKSKAHLVGGHRDFNQLMPMLKPDN